MRAFRIAYDGTGYRGYQRQPHENTVEDTLFDALSELGVAFEDGAPVGYAAAGRTDAGVSARAQTVAFESPEWLRPRALNSELPADIRAWADADVSATFHATHDAVERVYRYFLYAPDGDIDRATAVCEGLSGEQDFHNLTPDEDGTERDLSMTAGREGAFLVIDCRAGGFVRELVRRLVSLLEAVMEGDREMAFLERVLSEERLSGPEGVPPAAPEPLVLLDVRYPPLTFAIDEAAANSRREVFERRRRRRLAGTRVAETLATDGQRE